jgi:hypothetical protein
MNNNNDKKVQPDIKPFNRQDGFAFTAMAVVVAVILGMTGLFLKNHVAINVVATADHYSSTQSFWGAVSGIDFVLENLSFNADSSDTDYTFYNSLVNIDVDFTVAAGDTTYQIETTGNHGGHVRKLSMVMEPPEPFDNEWFNIDSTDYWGYTSAYECSTAGLPGGRYWGSSCLDCPGEDSGFQQPDYILDTLDLPLKYPDEVPPNYTRICYWLGRKEQNPKAMAFTTITNLSGVTGMELTLWLGAGVDVITPADQDRFQIGDNFEIYANDVLIESWSPEVNFTPLIPNVDLTIDSLTTTFTEFTFNLSSVLGSIDTLSLSFIGNTNNDDKYTGFAGVELQYDLNWVIDLSSLMEE